MKVAKKRTKLIRKRRFLRLKKQIIDDAAAYLLEFWEDTALWGREEADRRRGIRDSHDTKKT